MSDVLVTLVGLNPIVNYVSILQYCSNESTLFLISTGKQGNNTSSKFADNLMEISKKRFPDIKSCCKVVEKNELKQIYKSARDIVKFIKEKSEKSYDTLEVVLDITGSTKINSAIFYDVFISELKDFNNIKLSISYVGSVEKNIYERGFNNRCHDLKQLAEKYNVTKEELLKIQGYYDGDGIETKSLIKGINSEGFTLTFNMQSEIKDPKDIKEDIFIALDLADRFGGDLSKIYFFAESYKLGNDIDEEAGKETLIKRLGNDTSRDLEERLHLKLLGEK